MKKAGLRRGPKEYPAAEEAWRARGGWQPRMLPVAVYDADGGKVAKGICPGEKADPALRSG
jgi:hypothetical protein